MSLINMPCFSNEEEEKQSKLSSNNSCKVIPSLIREACAHCHVSSCLKSPSSLSSDDEFEEEEETNLLDSNIDNKHVIILEIRSRAMKAKQKPKDYLFADSLHWVLSPTTGKLLIAPKEERIDVEEDARDKDIDQSSDVFYSVKSCFSRCSSEKELDYFIHFRRQSIWEEFLHCEGWPFGLSRKALMLPPLPTTPSDSWTWREKKPRQY